MKRIVTYDIGNDKRRNKIFKLLKDYGQWVQYSVFELEIDNVKWIELEFALNSIITKEDSLCVYPLCQSCTKRVYYAGTLRYQLEEENNAII
ncbi:CRISPR-associated endonuclease Cas2 [Bacillus aquiflavi]|uniref:CRISPR-associated endoribonuclease Cas2 n=1 Tax=Bacillus aquiflavi TaxID=2672567 RepID=A0A6B3W0P0_9BACI|nr:CRISPR-associated endonuclease Cas2 [Bacillus aquiflavi]MBA4537821.1 CRISPR-associated endonuclease Cas2 [Bacillus aquiflavi]NEY82077.1 CRISPR-associated endonuclease Cas2 [Bacillus aquiflavi]UAC48356.1 CRISPR-associated endonuclease Cas2 [Bacillus aquiflavi]